MSSPRERDDGDGAARRRGGADGENRDLHGSSDFCDADRVGEHVPSDEDEGSGGEEHHPLSWRLPPEDSHSDWTVVVRTRPPPRRPGEVEGEDARSAGAGGGETRVYHVHKVIVSIGPRRSEYFASLFRQASSSSASASASGRRFSDFSIRRFSDFSTFSLGDDESTADGLSSASPSYQPQQQLSESATSTSEIELERSAAAAFPDMLDFIYSPHRGGGGDGSSSPPGDAGSNSPDDDFVTPANAVALVHLGRYFGVRPLLSRASRFVRSDLQLQPKRRRGGGGGGGGPAGKPPAAAATIGNATHAPLYLSEAALYHEERIRELARRACAERFADLDGDGLDALHPDLVRSVVSHPRLDCDSEELSVRVAGYCRGTHAAEIDGEFLGEVTDAGVMPRIHPDEALFLLNLSLALGARGEEEEGGLASLGFRGNGDKTSLKRRCLESCSAAWRDILRHSLPPSAAMAAAEAPLLPGEVDSETSSGEIVAASEAEPADSSHASPAKSPFGGGDGGGGCGPLAAARSAYSALPPPVKIDLLESALRSARSDLDASLADRSTDITALRTQLTEKDREIDRLRANVLSKSKQIRDLLSSLRSKENEIQTYDLELGRYVRVPKEYRFPRDLKLCTFAEFPADRYGEEPPTSMPLLGGNTAADEEGAKEGYLYRDEAGRALWPVYYYKCPY